MKRILALIVFATLMASQTTLHAEYAFTSFTVPNSTSTFASGINTSELIVGSAAIAGVSTGYVKSGPTVTTFLVPGSNSTRALGISNNGLIVGDYTLAAGGRFGFIKNGPSFTTINVPGSVATIPNAVNSSGVVVGTYDTPSDRNFAFIYANGVYTTIDPPTATKQSSAYGIDDANRVVGDFENASGTQGFLYDNGVYTTINRPNGGSTTLMGINNSGKIVGISSIGAFLLEGSIFSPIIPPGSTGTFPISIADSGTIVGGYTQNGQSGQLGFIASNLSAVPEPSSIGTSLILAAMAVLRYRKRINTNFNS